MGEKFRILIADDEDETRAFLVEALSTDFEVVAAHDGFDALESLARTEPDLILADVVMPLMDGFELCRTVRKNPIFKDTQIIFLSAKDDQETIKKSYSIGGDLFVQKPIDPTRLLKNLNLTTSRLGTPRPKKHPIEELEAMAKRRAEAHLKPVPTPVRPPVISPAVSPVAASTTAPPESPPKPAPEAQQSEEPKGKPRLMIVDDDSEIISFLELAFQDEFEVVWASDGLQAIERIIEYQPDIMFVDIMMPKMNGFQLCQSLRRNASYRTTPLLFLTAKSSRKDREYAERCGADAFITKPFDVQKLKELVTVIVEKPEFVIRKKKILHSEIHRIESDSVSKREDSIKIKENRLRYHNLQSFIDRNQ